MTGEGEIRRARESYVEDLIDLEEFERRVADVVFGRWTPTSSMSVVLKEAWTDARDRQTEHEKRIASLRARSHQIAAKHGLKM